MAKIIKAAEVQRRRQKRAKAKQVAEAQRRKRECANNTLAILIRLRKGFEKVIANVLAEDQESYLTVLYAVFPAINDILLSCLSDQEMDGLIEGIRDRNLPGL